jgi:hypothetical protein
MTLSLIVTGSVYGRNMLGKTRLTKLGAALTDAKVGLLLARESVHLVGNSIAPILVIPNISMLFQAIYAIMSVSLKKHHVKGTVKIRKYIVMENVRRGLYNVTANAWMKITSLQIVMEPAQNIDL